MQYKTIMFHMLEQQAQRQGPHQASPMRITTLDHYSGELRASHQAWMTSLSRSRPGSDQAQIASEALELAIQELEERLQADFPPQQQDEALSLDEAMTFLRRHTPLAS